MMNATLKKTLYIIFIIIFATIGIRELRKNDTKIKIGLSLPLTGEVSSWGQNALAGFKLAIKEHPKLADNIDLVIEDDMCDNSSANVFRKLLGIDKVQAIFGLVCSGSASVALPIAKEYDTPVIIIASKPDLTSIGDNVFRIYPSDNFEGKEAAKFIFNDLKKRKIAIIYSQNDWGEGIRKVFKSEFEKLGGSITHQSPIQEPSNDFRTEILKISTSNPEAIYMPVYPDSSLAIFKQMHEAGISIPIVGGSSFDSEEVYSNEYSDGVYYVVSNIPISEKFKRQINSLEGFENLKVSLSAVLAYDSANILLNAFSKDENNIKQFLYNTRYEGLSNPVIEFDENGDLKNSSFEVRIIKSGKTETYKTVN